MLADMEFDLQAISEQFDVFGEYLDAEPWGSGHINDTFAASYDQGGTRIRYVLQRVNHLIFKDPVAQMENIERVTTHIRNKFIRQHEEHYTRETLTLVPALDGRPYYRDDRGNYWRTYVLIEGAHSFDIAETPEQAREGARTFGRFQELLSDLPPPRLHETIPDFHHTPKRVEALERAIAEDTHGRAAAAREEIAFALEHKPMASTLLDLHRVGEMPERIVHNDTKFNNVLLDSETGRGVCVIDLDTVMPGLALYDFGDMVRTATSPAAEDEPDLNLVYMRLPMFAALVEGYLDSTGSFLNETEKAHMAFAGRLITYEIGVRFLTDHLAGDPYFKIHRPNHNLDRCRTQFKLVQSMEEQAEAMEEIVAAH